MADPTIYTALIEPPSPPTSRNSRKVDFSKPLDTSVVKDGVAIVTGGASGIGLAIVIALAEAGAKVAVADLNEEPGRKVEKDLSAKGLSVKFFPVDVSSWDSQLSLFKSVLDWSSDALDIVVPCAGITGGDHRVYIAPEEPSKEPPKPPIATINVTLIGVYYSADLALFYFNKFASANKSALRPQLLFVSSLAGYGGLPMFAEYNASKYGVRGLWKSFRGNVGQYGGTQTNLLAPTYLETAMTAQISPILRKAGTKVGAPEDASHAAMRAICDPEVDGRAICVASGEGKHGSNNFDLEDDVADHDAGKQMKWATESGVFGTFPSAQ